VVIFTETFSAKGRGRLIPSGERLTLEVVLDEPTKLPEVTGTQERLQFWKVGGIVEGQLPVWTLTQPHAQNEDIGRFLVKGASFSLDRIHHITEDFPLDELGAAVLKAAIAKEFESHDGDEVTAILTNFEMEFHEEFTKTTWENPFLGQSSKTKRDTLIGSFGDFEYALFQRDKNCEIRVRKKDVDVPSSVQITRIAKTLLKAIAFVHGQHTWPQFFRVRKGLDSLEEWTRAANKLPRSTYIPIPATACANGAKLQDAFRCLLETFLVNDKFADKFSHSLFLSREAGGDTTPRNVGSLGLCAVFEGMVELLHAKFIMTEQTPEEIAFEEEKARLAAGVAERLKGCPDGPMKGALERFSGIISSSKSYRPADKFQMLVKHLNLDWSKLEPAMVAWKRQRNTLAHGKSTEFRMKDLLDTSKIAGAINILALAAIGYHGLASASVLEDDYIRIP
jgi:hypothetical protein